MAAAHCSTCDKPYADRTGQDPCPRCGAPNQLAAAREKRESQRLRRESERLRAENAALKAAAAEGGRPTPSAPGAPVAVVVTALLLAGGAIGGWAFLRGSDRGPPVTPSPVPAASPPSSSPSSSPTGGEASEEDKARFEALLRERYPVDDDAQVTEAARRTIEPDLKELARKNGPLSDAYVARKLDVAKKDMRDAWLVCSSFYRVGFRAHLSEETIQAAISAVFSRVTHPRPHGWPDDNVEVELLKAVQAERRAAKVEEQLEKQLEKK